MRIDNGRHLTGSTVQLSVAMCMEGRAGEREMEGDKHPAGNGYRVTFGEDCEGIFYPMLY